MTFESVAAPDTSGVTSEKCEVAPSAAAACQQPVDLSPGFAWRRDGHVKLPGAAFGSRGHCTAQVWVDLGFLEPQGWVGLFFLEPQGWVLGCLSSKRKVGLGCGSSSRKVVLGYLSSNRKVGLK